MKVTHCGVTYDCATAVKCEVNKFIKLYDENGLEIASFDNINDFSDYTVTGGSFTAPNNCSVPVPVSLYKINGKIVATINPKGSDKTELADALDLQELFGKMPIIELDEENQIAYITTNQE